MGFSSKRKDIVRLGKHFLAKAETLWIFFKAIILAVKYKNVKCVFLRCTFLRCLGWSGIQKKWSDFLR